MVEIGKMSEQIKQLSQQIETNQAVLHDTTNDVAVAAVAPADHDQMVEKECETAKLEAQALPVGPEANSKHWKSIPLKNQVGQFGKDKCEKIDKVFDSNSNSYSYSNSYFRFIF